MSIPSKTNLLAMAFILWIGAAWAQGTLPTPTYGALTVTGPTTLGSLTASNLSINVKGAPYNAKCDGTTDDTATIQSAINAGVASGVSFTLLFPAGVCKTTGALVISGAAGQSIAIRGESRASSQLLVTGTADGIDVTMNVNPTDHVFNAALDVSDFQMLATGAAGTAIKAISTFQSSVSPKFHQLRIGYLGTGSFANGISTYQMTSLVVRDVAINSQNATGIAFQLDGSSAFPSLNQNFSDIYFWGFGVGIQVGNGTTSYVQGVEITNAQMQANNGACVLWNNNPVGYLGDMLLVSNSFCNGSITTNGVENAVLTGNYFLSGGVTQANLTGATTYVITGNTFLANNIANTNAISITSSQGTITGNHFYTYTGSGDSIITLAAGTTDNLISDNKCLTCGSLPVVNDLGTNLLKNNSNPSGPTAGAAIDSTTALITGEQTWRWQVPGSPTLTLEGTVIGWDYATQGETDLFISRGSGSGAAMNWYDTTTGSVGNMLMTLGANGVLAPQSGVQLPITTVAALPTCNTAAKATLRAVSDATGPAYNAALTGGGAVSIPVYCNGTAWTAH